MVSVGVESSRLGFIVLCSTKVIGSGSWIPTGLLGVCDPAGGGERALEGRVSWEAA